MVSRKKQVFFLVLVTATLFLLEYIALQYFDIFINQNIVFGLFGLSSLGWAVYGLAVFLLGYFAYKKQSICLTLALAGAFSNLMLRIVYGGVPDYIDVFRLSFNINDVVIVSSLAVFVFFQIGSRQEI